MKKRTIAVITSVMMLFSMAASIPSFAADPADELKSLKEDIKSKESHLKEQKSESKDLQKQINSLEKQIGETQNSIEELDSAIATAENDLTRLGKELKEAEKKVKEQNEGLNARLRSMYKNGSVGFLDVLLQSGDFSEFLNNIALVQKVFESDQQVLKDLQKAHDTIENKKKEIERLDAELKDSKATAQEAKKSLDSKQAELDDKKDAIDSDIAQSQEELDKMEAEAEALNEQIRQAAMENAKKTDNKQYYGGGQMCWPAPSYTRISCYFGWRTHPITGRKNYHGGTDLAAPGGSPILAAEEGTVIIASHHWSYGNYVVVDHGGGLATLYAHSSKLLVSKGQHVERGQKIALVGTTGSSTGNHLHFEVRKNGVRVNGLPYIQ